MTGMRREVNGAMTAYIHDIVRVEGSTLGAALSVPYCSSLCTMSRNTGIVQHPLMLTVQLRASIIRITWRISLCVVLHFQSAPVWLHKSLSWLTEGKERTLVLAVQRI